MRAGKGSDAPGCAGAQASRQREAARSCPGGIPPRCRRHTTCSQPLMRICNIACRSEAHGRGQAKVRCPRCQSQLPRFTNPDCRASDMDMFVLFKDIHLSFRGMWMGAAPVWEGQLGGLFHHLSLV